MSRAKFEAAKELIKAKQYAEARAVLRTINHPMALDLLAEIDQLQMREIQDEGLRAAGLIPAKPKAARRTTLGGIVAASAIVAFVLCIGLGIIGATLPKPTPTITPTPSSTFTPTMTYTPSATYTPSMTFTPSDTPTATPTLSQADITQTGRANATATRAELAMRFTATREQLRANQTATADVLKQMRDQQAMNRTATADSIQATREYIASFKPIAHGELVSYADNHVGDDVVIRGRVFNIIDDQDIQIWLDGGVDAVYVQTADSITGVYKGDYVTVYGTVAGFAEGTNAFGGSISQPMLINAVVTKP